MRLVELEYCNKLFAWEKQFENLPPEERTKQRLKEKNPILDVLLTWADSVSSTPKSARGKALHDLSNVGSYDRIVEGWACRCSRLMSPSFAQLHNSFEPQRCDSLWGWLI